ncbi:outer membrane protein assembly factor BamB family protein [Bremerella sp. P1]|uniref:outer membrane protein assembly factor BamB family protein n=1 Tax=Bremerella sp. P1 TaxID=3026424 RepID=UPI0023677407|nr:PQQ-binding-like beta-propeller repeat protein [Bremerella sp. P1]WDI44248.1 PQQ-binding-like beta-propeller repeat protein [Bremerella sp. P1]
MHIQKCVTRLFLFAMLVLAASPAMAQLGPRNFSPLELERLGLEKLWTGQLPIDPHRSEIEAFRQVVSLKNPLVVFEVEQDGRKATFASNELSIVGQPLGEEGAKAKADQYVARLDDSKGKPVVNRLEIPEITFLAQSDAGMLMSVNGRTGRTEWSKVYGRRGYPQPTPNANDDFVFTINDFALNCIYRNNGELVWTRKLEGVPIAGPVVGEEFVYIPMLDGTVVAYNFEGGPRLTPRYKSLGRIHKPMVASKTSVAWATDRDYFYVGYADRPLIRYRIESSGQILAPPSFEGPLRLFFTTETGYVYCLYAPDGSVQWRFSCGQPIDTSAIAIGDAVFVALKRGGLYKLSIDDGGVKWFVPRVEQFLAANDQYVYALDQTKNLVVLDINSGAQVGTLPLSGYDFFYTNPETDRIVIGSKTGRLVVLRSAAHPYPMVHVNVKAPKSEEEAPEGGKKEEDAGDTKPAVDPFAAPGGGVADPFAAPGGGAPAADPFGGSGGGNANPFGPPSGGGNNDPFGSGSSDPFGGGNSGGGSNDPFGGGASSDPFGSSNNGAGMSNDPFGN